MNEERAVGQKTMLRELLNYDYVSTHKALGSKRGGRGTLNVKCSEIIFLIVPRNPRLARALRGVKEPQ